MNELKEWIMTIAGTVLVLGIINMILPTGKTRKTTVIVSGFILMSVLLIPILNILGDLKNSGQVSIPAFLAEQERLQVVEGSNLYTEDQLALIAANYKAKLTEHINVKVMLIPGIAAADSSVVIEEDYYSEEFGKIEKIYISAWKGSNNQEKSETKSRLGKVKKIEKIIIDSSVFRIEKSHDEPPEDTINQELINIMKKEIKNEFLIDESLIIVEIKN